MKALVLLSGGVDSSTCLAEAVEKYGSDNVIALCIGYGQKHIREIEAAEKIAEFYHVKLKKLNLAPLFEDSDCSLLSSSDKEIPMESYADQLEKTDGKPVSTYVPFRNGLFLSCAASIAISNGCSEIYYGAHSDDAAGNAYPDCSEDFNNAINSAIYIGSGNQLAVKAPFIGLNKAQVISRGLKIQVPYEMTWSCYEGSERPCGMCGTCRDRQAAFKANGIDDPAFKNL
ncbi:MAG: 7-cyano-7-deazaguanine synthase QueC [Clostridia bacterium]|nr:7-cyano-7-deazaguanine synthase QueC [Clostridia bacterium]